VARGRPSGDRDRNGSRAFRDRYRPPRTGSRSARSAVELRRSCGDRRAGPGIPMVLGLGDVIASSPDLRRSRSMGRQASSGSIPDAATISVAAGRCAASDTIDPSFGVAPAVGCRGLAPTSHPALEAEAMPRHAARTGSASSGRAPVSSADTPSRASTSSARPMRASVRPRSETADRVFRTLDRGRRQARELADRPGGGESGAWCPRCSARQREPALLDGQLRALVEAGRRCDLQVMFPMVAVREELDAMRYAPRAGHERRRRRRPRPERSVEIGVMIEVPSAA
jgi:hypothetical protein